jgi:hypothetical protein
MKNKFLSLLSRNDVSIIILIVSIFFKALQIALITFIGRDRILHLVAAQNFLEGKGFSINKYSLSNPSIEIHEKFCLWPPGYGFTLMPLLNFLKEEFILIVFLVELFFFIVFVLLLRSIVYTLTKNKAAVSTITIIACFFPYHFINASLGTDLPALSFLLVYAYIIISIWNTPEKKSLIWGLAAGLALAIAALFRYMYLPLLPIIASVPLLIAIWKQNKKVYRNYLALLISSIILCFSQFTLTKIICNNPLDAMSSGYGLYPENLKVWFGAVHASFIDATFAGTLITKAINKPFEWWLSITAKSAIFEYILFIGFSILFFYKIRKKQINNSHFFILNGLVISYLILFELGLLSLTNAAPQFNNGTIWTYVIEGRYFGFIVIFLQILFIVYLFKSQTLPVTVKRFLITLAIVMSLTVVHEVYYSIKTLFNYRELRANFEKDQDYIFFEKYLKDFIKQNPSKNIMVTSTDEYYPSLASLIGHKGIFNTEELLIVNPQVTEETVLFSLFHDLELEKYSAYINRDDVKQFKRITQYTFYIQHINPADN